MTGEDWVTFNQESGQTIQFTYSGDYILRIVAPKAGLNLRAITLSQSNASVIPGTISAISTYAEENISLNNQEGRDFIGFGAPGAWAEYKVDVKESGNYWFKYVIASDALNSGASQSPQIRLEIDGKDQGTVEVEDTKGWVKFEERLGQSVYMTKGIHLIKIISPTAYLNIAEINIDSDKIHQEGENVKDSVGVTFEYGPFAAYNENAWTEYSIKVDRTGKYQFIYQYGTQLETEIILSIDGKEIEKTLLPPTGDWTTWRQIEGSVVTLEKGEHTIHLLAPKGALNLDWFELVPTESISYPKLEKRKTIHATAINGESENVIDYGDTLGFNENSFAEYIFDVNEPGQYSITYIYAKGAGEENIYNVLVDDEKMLTHELANTYDWNSFKRSEIGVVNLQAGIKKLKVQAPEGYLNLKTIELTEVKQSVQIEGIYFDEAEKISVLDNNIVEYENGGKTVFNVNVYNQGIYNLNIYYSNWASEIPVEVMVDNVVLDDLSSLDSTGGNVTKLGIAPVQLEEGTHKLTITAPQGNLGLKQLELRPVVVDVVKTQGTTYLEAENSQDMRNTTKYENFMGYGEWGYTEHIIDVPQDGKYNARIQYAIGDMGERQASPLTLSLDHKTVKEDELKFTGDWMQFSTVTLGDRKSTRLNSSHEIPHRMPASACTNHSSQSSSLSVF